MRLFEQHGKHIPANPAIIVQNMPGAAGDTGGAYREYCVRVQQNNVGCRFFREAKSRTGNQTD
jgi:hypothetical protein